MGLSVVGSSLATSGGVEMAMAACAWPIAKI